MRPVCLAVERDLRLSVHAIHLKHMEPLNLKSKEKERVPVVVHLLQLPAIRVIGTLVDIKKDVRCAAGWHDPVVCEAALSLTNPPPPPPLPLFPHSPRTHASKGHALPRAHLL